MLRKREFADNLILSLARFTSNSKNTLFDNYVLELK